MSAASSLLRLLCGARPRHAATSLPPPSPAPPAPPALRMPLPSSPQSHSTLSAPASSSPTPEAAPPAAATDGGSVMRLVIPRARPFAPASAASASAVEAADADDASLRIEVTSPTAQAGTSPLAGAGADAYAGVNAYPPSPRIEASASAQNAAAAPPARDALAGLSVLLVDDERDVRLLGAALLRRLGCGVVVLEDGADVARALEEAARPFDALVLDIHMRRSDGADVCADLREGRHLRCAVVALTGATAPADVARYFARGFDVVLAKPFGLRTLAAALVEARAAAAGRLGDGNARIARMKAGAGAAKRDDSGDDGGDGAAAAEA